MITKPRAAAKNKGGIPPRPSLTMLPFSRRAFSVSVSADLVYNIPEGTVTLVNEGESYHELISFIL